MYQDTHTPLHGEYLRVMQEVCANEPQAFRWFCQVLDAAMLWDHVVDGDPIDMVKANETFTALTMEWILNDWFHKNRAMLVTVLSGCVSAWKSSGPGSEASYLPYTQIPSAMCLLIHGSPGVDRFMPRIHELVRRERFEDVRRDHQPFLIVGLPRSRTAWLAAFLTDGDVTCYHERLRDCDTSEDYAMKLMSCQTPIVGDADPSLPMVYAHAREKLPPHKVVFIIREREEARESFKKMLNESGADMKTFLDHTGAWAQVEQAFQAMQKMCPDAMAFRYEDLDKPEVMKQLAEYCTGLPFNTERFDMFNEMRVTAIPEKVQVNQRLIK